MKVIDEGVIKYDRTNFSLSSSLEAPEYEQIEYWRKKLFRLNLIGEYKDISIGFGNVSTQKNYSHLLEATVPQFLITGTQTGKYPNLNGDYYTRVVNYELENLKIYVIGPIEASSEALTHAALYKSNLNIKAIFHVHSNKIWNGMKLEGLQSIDENVSYGTLEMAKAVEQYARIGDSGVLYMKGHEDGILIFGSSLNEVGELTVSLYQKYCL
jgi:ribulose-5-phosphate 4-epimerase/fuculose-1-phosphate aldolase